MLSEERQSRLTAYALGELDAAESTDVETSLAGDPEAQQFVAACLGLGDALGTALRAESCPALTPRERTRLERTAVETALEARDWLATPPLVPAGLRALVWLRLCLLAALPAVAVLLALFCFLSRGVITWLADTDAALPALSRAAIGLGVALTANLFWICAAVALLLAAPNVLSYLETRRLSVAYVPVNKTAQRVWRQAQGLSFVVALPLALLYIGALIYLPRADIWSNVASRPPATDPEQKALFLPATAPAALLLGPGRLTTPRALPDAELAAFVRETSGQGAPALRTRVAECAWNPGNRLLLVAATPGSATAAPPARLRIAFNTETAKRWRLLQKQAVPNATATAGTVVAAVFEWVPAESTRPGASNPVLMSAPGRAPAHAAGAPPVPRPIAQLWLEDGAGAPQRQAVLLP